jgi:hypothetical protein
MKLRIRDNRNDNTQQNGILGNSTQNSVTQHNEIQ